MAISKYSKLKLLFRKVLIIVVKGGRDVLVRNDVETVNEAKKQLQKISEPQPKKKKQKLW